VARPANHERRSGPSRPVARTRRGATRGPKRWSLAAPHGFRHAAHVPYDEVLAARIRALIGDEDAVREQRMFGGLAFLLHGNMAVAASGQGGVLVRVDPSASDRLVEESPAELMVMRGRPMPGWLRVDAGSVREDAELGAWVERGIAFARSLPAK
jgi:TfoX/Sxy family transcriptional regulator of competence genes